MKQTFLLIAIYGMLAVGVYAQSPKGGIINFSVNGFSKGMGLSSSDAKSEPDICFIGATSTRMGDSLLSNMLLTLTEAALSEKILNYSVYPVTRVRPAHVLDEMNGSLNVMQTITEKKAFKELGYDDVVAVNCRITQSGMKTKKGDRLYTPSISLTIKVTGKDGKTKFKKEESIKFKETQISGELIEVPTTDNSSMNVSFKSLKEATVTTTSDKELKGVSSMQLLDWYKQVLDNLLIQ